MDVFDRAPINRSAALVTGQSGCASDDTLTDEQKRENLVAVAKALDKKIISLPKKSKERKLLGLKRKSINDKINSLRPAKKCKGIDGFFIDIARSELTAFQFSSMMGKAAEKLKKHNDNNTP